MTERRLQQHTNSTLTLLQYLSSSNCLYTIYLLSLHAMNNVLHRFQHQQFTPMFTTPDQQFITPTAQFTTPTQQVLTEHISFLEDSPHSTESNRSAKLEHHTASFANQFLKATYFSLQTHLSQQAWFSKPRKLGVVYFPLPLSELIVEHSRRWKLNLVIRRSLRNRMVEFHFTRIHLHHKIIQSFPSRYVS